MKKIFPTIALTLIASAAVAAPLTPSQALERVAAADGARRLKTQAAEAALAATRLAPDGLEAVYVFTTGTDGFLLVSADDCAPALLGYSDSGAWSPDSQSPEFEWWLGEYAAQIAAARENKAENPQAQRRQATRADRTPIAPLMKSTWNQTHPYNLQCPVVNGSRSVTGCVATAMAQVMYYWKYPTCGTGEVEYVLPNLSNPLYLDFTAQDFDWDNMLDSYRGQYKSVNSNAVAYLMKACGYSVQMEYSSAESGAFSFKVSNALRTYFNYDKALNYMSRDGYTLQEWEEIVYNALKTGPVVYSGQSAEGGHCFVCDGYDANGYFHFNWGWGGMSDGYFLLSALNPGDIGTGGYSGGYNSRQSIVADIMPPVGRLSVLSLEIGNAGSDSGNVPGQGFTYRINEYRNIELNMSVRVSGGVVSSPIEVVIYETDPATLKNGAKVMQKVLDEPLMAPEGMLTKYTAHVDFDNYDISKLYTMNVYYTLKNQQTLVGTLRMAASSGVDGITDSEDFSLGCEGTLVSVISPLPAAIEVFDMGGRKVAATMEPTLDISQLAGGVYLVRATASDGSVKTMKVRR